MSLSSDVHTSVSHANGTIMADSGNAYGCILCSVQSPSLFLWMSHVRLVHPLDENISIPCPVSGCNAVYAKTNLVLLHIYRRHRGVIICSSNNPVVNASSENSVNEVAITPASHPDLSLPGNISHDVDILLHRDEHERKKKSCCF